MTRRCGEVSQHSVIVVRNDVKHDEFAVKVYENKALDLLKNEGLKIDVIEKFSDGAAAQYKGKKQISATFIVKY